MPKIKKEQETPFDGAILRALRVQSGMQSTQFAAELSKVTGYAVLSPHISGYENGTRFVPDWLVEGACRILGKRLVKTIDPMLFPEYAARRITGAQTVSPSELRRTVSHINRFAPERRRLIAAGRAA